MTNGKQLKTHSEIVNLIAIDSSHLGSINVGLSLQTLITALYICMAIIHCISYHKSKCQILLFVRSLMVFGYALIICVNQFKASSSPL